MPPRLARTRSRRGDIQIYDRGVDATTDPICLELDTKRPGFKIVQRWLPVEAGAEGGIQLSEWTWQNGTAGAGTSVETPSSYAGGACSHGENVWLRQLGKAQPAGKLTELTLPTQALAMTSGRFTQGAVFGPDNDLYITTQGRSIVKVPNGTGDTALIEQDCGSGAVTYGIAVFNGTGTSCLYVGDTANGIWEFNGSAWTEGEDGGANALTRGRWLQVPYWVLGDELSTGGSASGAGLGDDRLVMVDTLGKGFYHVSGDPQVAANWSSLTTVGTGGTVFPIHSTTSSNRVVWFGTGMGVRGCNEAGYAPNLTKAIELFASQNTCTAIQYWAGMLWCATEQGLVAFTPNGERVDIPTFAQFGATGGVTPIYGRPRALAPSEDGLYVGYYNDQTDTSYVGCLLLDGDGFRWSMAEAVIEGQEVTYLQQVSGNDGYPRLFIGTVDTSGAVLHLYVQDLPLSGDPETDALNETDTEFMTAWTVTLSRFNGGRAISKTARRFMLEADGIGEDYADNAVEFLVANDGGDFESQGTASGTSVSTGRWNAQPAEGTAQATSLQVKLSVTQAADAPVVIRTASVLYSSHPELSRVVTAPVVIGEGQGKDPRATLQRVERAQRAGPLAMDDFFGRRIEGTITVDNETVVMEAERNGFTIHADVTILYTRQVSRADAGDLVDCGYLVS
jgi:hypothetical protein